MRVSVLEAQLESVYDTAPSVLGVCYTIASDELHSMRAALLARRSTPDICQSIPEKLDS